MTAADAKNRLYCRYVCRLCLDGPVSDVLSGRLKLQDMNQRHKKCWGGNCGTNSSEQPKPHLLQLWRDFYVVLR